MKLALIQQAFKGTKEATNAYTTKLIAQAAKKKADLVCLNELHQAPYFCQSEDVLNFDLAKDYEKDLEFWSKEAKKNNIILLTSLFEKRACGLYHNTAVVFEKDGSIAGRYRKMHIPEDPNFYEKFYFTQGDLGFEPINTSVGRLGVLVCWDQWFPEAARIMALKGAQILIYPTAIGWFDSDSEEEKQRQLEAWIAVQRGHAVANGLSVVAINRAGFEGAYLSKPSLESKLLDSKALKAKNHALKEDNKLNSKRFAKGASVDGIRFWGNSFVFGPQGEELFRANSVDEGVFFVEIDLDRNEEVRRWWQFFRDRRIDFYKPLLKRFDD
ncbi:carbon-nitrogen hydrolase [Campylobacter troglodytis]|uniref:carbon-nitrogen hydrolase n=1 Tax=Campylobacter troglodytis TaxID=654363 RepID=UPI001156FD4C|nr:carbon-nitrogen hydrolase [Campylobacter troglodytis]TQR56925.1 carbon-nitrogen hydrolase [Campylobacter troglodytis]